MRHQNDQQAIHPTALMVGADMGMDTRSMKEVIASVAEANPAILIGGYNVDVAIISLVAVLQLEDHMQRPDPDNPDVWIDTNRDEITRRVNEILGVMYVGI